MTPVLTRTVGPASAFHARVVPDDVEPTVWWFEADRPALVLGSRQSVDLVDLDRCAADGVEVVVRRSGGGAVLLQPGDVVWVDVLLPSSSPRWRADVAAAMVDIGTSWAIALAPLTAGELTVHRGAMERSAWSELVCFDGLGPGEVLLDGAKLVGLSQRRTRTSARFQCAVHLAHDPQRIERYLRGPLPAERHRSVATLGSAIDPAEVVDELVRALGA